MERVVDPLAILIVAINFYALGTSRIRALISAVALQGILLGVFPLLLHEGIGGIGLRGVALIVGAVALKGFVIPGFLVHAMREADVQREVKPAVGFATSLVLGAIGTALALQFSITLELTEEHAGTLVVPASFSTVLTGFLLLTTRKTAILQVLGYLVLENGIFLFGLLLLEAMPFLVEIGVLLDLFTGVFVMGIIIHHISREFASISTEHLTELKE
jgi:hydrogenase-4 component E